ncbi:MAG: hypothetical protein GF411_14110 [Candidatus Lokiarchaeota archaeon]|nr:hypothetical protein [Candidatus Lokiarchaeota archaeon]
MINNSYFTYRFAKDRRLDMGDRVIIYGMPNCGKCEAAKDKLKRFNIPFEEASYEKFVTVHDGWRNDGSIKVMAARNYYGETHVPLIRQNGTVFDYPSFMKHLKNNRLTPDRSKHATEVRV